MDWTAYRKPDREIRGVTVVAVSNSEMVSVAAQEARQVLHLPADKVFHAYDDTPEIQYGFLNSMLSAGMTIRIGALLYDTAEGRHESIERLSEVEFIHQIALTLLGNFLPVYPLDALAPDRDLEGKKQEERFKKAIRTLCHIQQIHAPRIGFCTAYENKSGSELVQFADAVIYNLYRLRRDALEPPLRRLLKGIIRDSYNLIRSFADLENGEWDN